MKIARITADNIDLYPGLPGDVAECIGREYFRGLAAENEEDPEAFLIWELKNIAGKSRGAQINYLSAESDAAFRAVFDAFRKEAAKDRVTEVSFELPPDDALSGFLSEAGFTLETRESRDLVVSVSEFSKLSVPAKKAAGALHPLREIDETAYRNAVLTCLFHERKGLLEDLAYLPKDFFDTDISSYILSDDSVSGLLLLHATRSGLLFLDLLFTSDPNANLRLASMLSFTVSEIGKKYAPDTKLILRRHDERTENLFSHLFPEKRGKTVLCGSIRL